MDHDVTDRVSMRLAGEVAAGLAQHPEWVELARANLARWRARNADVPSLLRCYDQWDAILAGPLEGVLHALTRTDDEGQRLRQSSPFVGVVHYRRVWQIKRSVWDSVKERSHEPGAA